MTRGEKANSIDAYIAGFSPDVRAMLEKIRAVIRKAAPDAVETISYQMPAFVLGEGERIYFAAFKKHIGVYPPVRGDAKLAKELAPYEGEKGNLKFPLHERIPYALIRRIVEFRLKKTSERASSRKAAKKK